MKMRIVSDGSSVARLADSANFSGRVWRTTYLEPTEGQQLTGYRFVYEPGARSHWHVHDREQAIVGIHGHGVVAWEGLDVPVRLSAGDWWHVQPGVPHWHGATPDTTFAHLAIAGGSTTWLHAVSDEDYLRTQEA